jgi:hypothetical protein
MVCTEFVAPGAAAVFLRANLAARCCVQGQKTTLFGCGMLPAIVCRPWSILAVCGVSGPRLQVTLLRGHQTIKPMCGQQKKLAKHLQTFSSRSRQLWRSARRMPHRLPKVLSVALHVESGVGFMAVRLGAAYWRHSGGFVRFVEPCCGVGASKRTYACYDCANHVHACRYIWRS